MDPTANIVPSIDHQQSAYEPKQQAPIELPLTNLLAQLPTAASTVFSTFSNMIKGTTATTRDNIDSSLNSNTPSQIQTQDYSQSTFTPYEDPNAYNYSLMNPQSVVNPINPTFYSPSDYSGIASKKNVSDTKTNNTFRIGGGRKVYAHIPGLTSKHLDNNFQAVQGNFYAQPEQQPMMMSSPIQSTYPSSNAPAPFMPPVPTANSSFSPFPSYPTPTSGIPYTQSENVQSNTQNIQPSIFNPMQSLSEPINPSTMTPLVPTLTPEVSTTPPVQNQTPSAPEINNDQHFTVAANVFTPPSNVNQTASPPPQSVTPSAKFSRF